MKKKILFSHHSILKFQLLKKHGVNFTRADIEGAINNPDTILEAEKSRKIAQKLLNAEHIIRVIFEEQKDVNIVITFYPARRSRYENKL